MGGKAFVRGLRVTVGMIVGQVGVGHSVDEILADYPYLEREDVMQALRDMGHEVAPVGNVAGGMGAIEFCSDGGMNGAACWRADGTPIGLGGGYARKGVRFRPEARR